MKKRLLSIMMLLFVISVNGQINIATGGTVTTCSDVFVDSGGLGGNYSSNENNQITICPDTAGNYIELNFTTINIEGGAFDFLILYNGTSSLGELLGTITENTTCDVTQYTSSAPGGCITIVFESDGSFNQSGWEASVSCTTTPGAAPSAPANSVCGGSGAFCADAGALEFPNTANTDCVPDAPGVVVSNSCLGSAPNPAWYFIEIGVAGNIIIDISQTTGPGGTGTGLDVDYVVWGPFPDVTSSCVDFTTGNCTNDHNCTGTAVDCSYSSDPTETATISNAQVGEFYMFLITNFDGASGFITLTQTNIGTPGAGSTDCCPFLQGTDPTSCGATDGVIEISLLTPNTSYTITYNDPAAQSVTTTSDALGVIQITGLSEGNYTNIDTNTPGCPPEDITLSSTTGATLTSLTATSPVCSGANAIFNLVGTPNATATYTIDGGAATTIILDGSGNGIVTVPGVTFNSVIVLSDITISGCSTTLTDTATVVVNSIPSVTNLIAATPVCTGQDAVFTITGTPNSVVTYTIDGGAAITVTLDVTGNGVVTITGVTSNTIIVLSDVALNGCNLTISNTATVLIDPILVVTSLVEISPVCSGQDAVFNVVGTASSTITYTINGGTPATLVLDGAGNGIITIAGITVNTNITLTNMTFSGCSIVLTDNATVVVTSNPNVTSLTTVSPVCSGQDAVFTILGTPNGVVTYTINGGVPSSVTLDGTGVGVVTDSGISVDTTIILNDIVINSCATVLTNTETVVVSPNPVLTSLTSNGPVCTEDDAIFTIVGTANAVVTYSLDGGLTTQTIVLDGSGNGIITIAAVTSNQTIELSDIQIGSGSTACNEVLTNTLTIVANLKPYAGTDGSFITCDTATSAIHLIDLITGEQSGGDWLQTSGFGGTFNPNSGIYTPSAGATTATFTYTVVGIPPCIDDVSNVLVSINNTPSLGLASSSSPTTCLGTEGVIVLTASNLPDGTYTINYEDAIPVAQTATMVVVGNVGTISGLASGTYNNITVTNLGCISIEDVDAILTDPLPPTLTLNSTSNTTTCLGSDGSIILSTTNLPNGTYTVNYEDATANSQTETMVVVGNVGTVFGLSAGTYNNITVTNNNCTSLEDVDILIIDPPLPMLTINATTNPTTCDGADGTITLTTTNLPDGSYTVIYEDASSTTQTEIIVVSNNVGIITGLLEGVYDNMVITYNNCTSIDDIDIVLSDPLPSIIAIIATSNPTICEATDGSITLSTSNLPDGTYVINYEDATATPQMESVVVVSNIGVISGLSAGTYNNITVTFISCTSIEDIDAVLFNPLPSISSIISTSDPTTCDGTDGSITLSILNIPDGTYTINYEDAAATPQTETIIVVGNVGVISGLSEGTFNNITVTYLSCTSVEDIDVILTGPIPSIIAIISTSDPTTCDGTDGSITLSILNIPDGTYTINYEDVAATPQTETIVVIGNVGVISGLSEGTFNNITVTYLSCTSVEDIDVVLTDPIPSIVAIITIGNPTMCSGTDGSITLSVANLIDGVYTLNYDDANVIMQTTTISVVGNVGTIINLSAGIYNNITIISFSCSSIEDIDVVLSDPIPSILAILEANNPTTCNGSDGSIVLSTFNLPDATYIIDYEDSGAIAQTATMVVVANVGTIIGLPSEVYNNITVTNVGCTSIEDIDVVLTDPLPPVLNDSMNMQPVCETDTIIDGVIPHDLTSNIDAILGGQTGITVTFYETLANSNTGTGQIINDTAYLNINPTPPISTQVIYVRAVDDITGCISFTSFTITVMTIESNIPTALVECDDDNDGFHYFTLHNSVTISEITNGAANVVVAFYETLAEANQGIVGAQLSSPYFNIVAYNQTVYARADLTTLNCFRIVELELNVINSPALPLNDLVYNQCEDIGSSDGFVFFDLLSFEVTELFSVIIANGDSISNYTTNYYTALDASGNPDVATLIANPSSYQNTTAPNQIIYASVTDNSTGCIAIKQITLYVDLLPSAIYTPIEECDDETANGILTFNLFDYITQITNGATNVEVSFYENFTDAEAGVNSISDPEHFENAVNPQSIFAGVLNPETGCRAVSIVKLHVNPNPTPLSTDAIEASLGDMLECDGNVDGSGDIPEQIAEFDLTQWETQILTGTGPSVELGVSANYYISLADAEAGTNSIASPSNYTNISNPQTIYISVINDGTGLNPVSSGSGCYTIVSFEIYVPVPNVSISGNDVLCIDANGVPLSNIPLPILTATAGPDAAASYNYQWTLNGVVIVGATNQSLTVLQAGEYTVTVSGPIDFNCINFASQTIIASGVPDNFNANVTTNAFSDSHQIVATATSSIPEIEFWYSLDDGEPTVDGIFNNISPGIHIVTITDGKNCWKEEIEVLIIDYPHFFTPNGDGINDTWQIIGIEGIPISQIYIFDRFGKLLKQLDPDSIGWDGTYNGNQLPATDYWFKINYIEGSALGIQKEFRAHFSLKR